MPFPQIYFNSFNQLAIFVQNCAMAEDLYINKGSRKEKYQQLIPQLSSLIGDEADLIANCANITAALKQTFGFFWVGFYFVKENELVLGPFQGEIACTRIQYGKGVCGAAWENKKTYIVKNVNDFEGHIACSAKSKSEIVVPVIKEGKVRLVIDIDSDQLNDFSDVDQEFIEQIAELIKKKL